MLKKSLPILGLLALAFTIPAGEPRTPEIVPSRVKFSSDSLPLHAALKELHDQTGNPVHDLRTDVDKIKLRVATKPGDFWPTLDALCEQADVGFNAYKLDGAIALVDARYRKSASTHYRGIFRFAVKSTEVIRDEETQTHQCRVTLDTAWEPRFKVLFLNLEQAEATFGKTRDKLDGDASFNVAGKCATQGIKVTMKAPPRGVGSLDSLQGTIRVIGVPKVLEFAFDKLKPIKPGAPRVAVKDLVAVSVTAVEVRKSRWTVELGTIYPEGALVRLQSFEEPVLLAHNRVWLTWGVDPKSKKPYELEASDLDPQEAKTGTKIQYHFESRQGIPLPPPGAEVTLRYRTPSRVIAFTVPFSFRDLPLP